MKVLVGAFNHKKALAFSVNIKTADCSFAAIIIKHRPGCPQRAGGPDPAARGRGGRGRDGDPRRKVRGVKYSTVQYSTVQ